MLLALPYLTASDANLQDDDTKKPQTALTTTSDLKEIAISESEQATKTTKSFFLGISCEFRDTVKTHREGFEKICQFIYSKSFKISHPESLDENGVYYSQKNEPTIQYYAKLLTGRSKNKKWSRSVIEETPIRIAEIGAGLGLSALSLVAHVAKVYEQEKWTLKRRIQLDLYDYNPIVFLALNSIKELVNAAFGQYFEVSYNFINITNKDAITRKSYYNSVLCFNVINNITDKNQQAKAMKNIHLMMGRNALMLVVADGSKEPKEHWFEQLVQNSQKDVIFKRLKQRKWEKELAKKSEKDMYTGGFTYVRA